MLSELNNSIQMKESCLEGCKKVLLCFSQKKIFWSQWTNHFEFPVDLVIESSYVLSRRKAEIETESTVNVSAHPSVLPPDLQGTYNSPHHVMGWISPSASLGICDSQASGWDSLFFVDSSYASIRSMRITVDSAMQQFDHEELSLGLLLATRDIHCLVDSFEDFST